CGSRRVNTFPNKVRNHWREARCEFHGGGAMTRNESVADGNPRHAAYLLDNAASQAGRRFRALSALYDDATMRYLERCGVRAGWNCLEIGGGGGSIAKWLSSRVGPLGRVLVTDLNPRFLDELQESSIEVRTHNIVTDELPDAAFDLIHARLVLMHIPERQQ